MEYSITVLYTELARVEQLKNELMSNIEYEFMEHDKIYRYDKIISDLTNTLYLLENNR